MSDEKLPELLSEFAERAKEPVPPGLAEEIKKQIPQSPGTHKSRMDTINIIIDLRIGKVAAAAVIVLTMVLWAGLLRGRDSADGSIYQDAKLVMNYLWGGAAQNKLSTVKPRYEYLVQQGVDVAYYGDGVSPEDSDAVLMQWKLPDGRYRVILGDLTERDVGAEELIKLQTRMLKKRTK